MKAINIQWDTDNNENVTLPTEIEIPDEITNEEEISEYLSNKTGFCHFGFSITD